MNKWPVAGLCAGIAVFIWGAVAHMVLQFDSGYQSFANEDAVLAAIKENAKEPGLYYYPYETDPAKMEAKLAASPRGILTYTPAGVPFSMPKLLAIQAAITIAAGLIAAWLFTFAAPSLPTLGSRILFVAMIGVFATVAVVAPYWNWYGYPPLAVAMSFVEEGVGWAIAGVVLGKLIR